MTKEEIFALWAPGEAVWSRWVKPVLFACLDSGVAQSIPGDPLADFSWAPPARERTAFVLDLPAAEGVFAGIVLAGRGYRPIPLYNAVPAPLAPQLLDPLTNARVAAVNVLPIMAALRKGAEDLAQIKLPPDAPPVFLLDAGRAGHGKMAPGEFDNRSVSFTTDFPSANFLASQQIGRAILVQKNRLDPQPDLAHTLLRWQEGGLTLERKRLDMTGGPEPFTVPRPRWYRAMFQRALAAVGLRRARDGGFGSWVPESSGGG